MKSATATFLGKIAQVIGADIANAPSVEEALKALRRDFTVEIE